jgi:hypothetical protein
MPEELDNLDPTMGQEPAMDTPETGTHQPLEAEDDQEGKMAKADLYKLATYSHKLFKQLSDDDKLESWIQAKITKAADYMASVYHYLEYEMKFSEYGHHLDNSDTLSEAQKQVLKNRLMEAKEKVKELKKSHAEKINGKKVSEGIMSGGEMECAECGGTGVVMHPGMEPSEKAKRLAAKHNTATRAHYAAMKRLQAEEGAVDEEVENAFTAHKRPKDEGDKDYEKTSSTGGTIKKKGSVITHKHNPDRFSDEPHDSGNDRTKSHAKARSSADKAGDREMDKAQEKDSKAWGKANPGKQTIMKGGVKTTNESTCAECGMMMEKCSCMHESAEKTMSRAAKGVMKYGKVGMKALAKAGKDGKDLDKVRDKYDKYDESAKPSAGLSAAKKSATVKKAKAGGDIGKPGKGFKKVAAKAAEKYGSKEKGEKVAAAAMWKNIKETTAYIEEKKTVEKKAKKDYDGDGKIESNKDEVWGSRAKAAVKSGHPFKESTEFDRMQEQLSRLNRAEKPMVAESREVDQIRALTQKLLG